MRAVIFVFLALACGFSVADSGRSKGDIFQDGLVLHGAGSKEQVVYLEASNPCALKVTPDAPFRMVRAASGDIYGIFSHIRNFRAKTTDGASFQIDCNIIYSGGRNSDPYKFDDFRWVASFWHESGNDRVYALVHNEYHGHRYKGRCKFEIYLPCWSNSIILAEASDITEDLVSAKNVDDYVIAAPQFPYDKYQGRNRGFFNPTNVVQSGRYMYFLAETTGGGGQRSGVCLFRRETGAAPLHWLAYNQGGFTDRMTYSEGESGKVCETLRNLEGPITGLVRHSSTGQYIAIFVHYVSAGRSELAYSTSLDLIHWNAPRPLLSELPLMWSRECSDAYRYGYPSIVDPSSSDRDFGTVGDNPYIYLTRFHVDGCKLNEQRDLVRFPLNLIGAE